MTERTIKLCATLPLLSLIWVLVSCGIESAGEKEEVILATVGERTVSVAEFRTFVAGLPEWTRSPQQGEARVRDYLQSLIDRELILGEAERQELDNSAEVAANLLTALKIRLGEEMEARMVRPRVRLSPEDLRQEFEENNWARQIKISHIFLRDRESAETAMSALLAGTPFEAVAHEFSDNRNTAVHGGEKPYFYSRINAIEAVREPLFSLGLGEISAIIKVPKGYEIFKVVEERTAAFGELQPQILKVMLRERTHEARKTYVDSLERAFTWQLNPQVMGQLMAILRGSEPGPDGKKIFRLSVADRERKLFTFRDGFVTIGEAIAASQFIRQGRYVTDSLKVAVYLDRDVRTPRLMLLHAGELGMDQNLVMVSWLQGKEKELLIRAMRAVAISRTPPITEEEMRAYYDARPTTFRTSATATVVEVQVEVEEQAAEMLARLAADAGQSGSLVEIMGRLRQRLEAGQSTGEQIAAVRALPVDLAVVRWLIERLESPLEKVKLLDEVVAAASSEHLVETLILRQMATEHSVRHGSREAAGELVLHNYDRTRYGRLVEAAMEAEIGAVLGPMEHESHFSIAKVIGKQASERQSFDKVRRRVKSSLRRQREHDAFERWLLELRDANADRLQLFDDNIATLGAEVDAEQAAATPPKGAP